MSEELVEVFMLEKLRVVTAEVSHKSAKGTGKQVNICVASWELLKTDTLLLSLHVQ